MAPRTGSASRSGSGVLFSGSGMNMLGSGPDSFFTSGMGAVNESANDTAAGNDTLMKMMDMSLLHTSASLMVLIPHTLCATGIH